MGVTRTECRIDPPLDSHVKLNDQYVPCKVVAAISEPAGMMNRIVLEDGTERVVSNGLLADEETYKVRLYNPRIMGYKEVIAKGFTKQLAVRSAKKKTGKDWELDNIVYPDESFPPIVQLVVVGGGSGHRQVHNVGTLAVLDKTIKYILKNGISKPPEQQVGPFDNVYIEINGQRFKLEK